MYCRPPHVIKRSKSVLLFAVQFHNFFRNMSTFQTEISSYQVVCLAKLNIIDALSVERIRKKLWSGHFDIKITLLSYATISRISSHHIILTSWRFWSCASASMTNTSRLCKIIYSFALMTHLKRKKKTKRNTYCSCRIAAYLFSPKTTHFGIWW